MNDNPEYMVCNKHPYLLATSATASALGCPYCKLKSDKEKSYDEGYIAGLDRAREVIANELGKVA